MKKIIILFLLISNHSFSQDLSNLKEKNGFREIKLNTEVQQYSNFEKSSYEDEIVKLTYGMSKNPYELKNKYNTNMEISNSRIRNILLSTIDNRIFEIIIDIEYDTSLLYDLQLIFGEPTQKTIGEPTETVYGSWTKEFYSWEIDNIKCSLENRDLYNGMGTNDIYVLKYVDKSLEKIYISKGSQNKKDNRIKKQKKLDSEF